MAPTSPSKNIEPGFSGTAGEATQVTVHVFEGTTEVSSASTTASGGKWSTTTLSKALPSGKHKFTAYAMEVSGLGNAEGKSNEVGFEVDTLPPEVVDRSLAAVAVEQPTPVFSGAATKQPKSSCMSSKAGGSVEAPRRRPLVGNGRRALGKALPAGKHTFKAYATEVSGLGNGEGRSNEVSFEVDTLPPEVSIVAPTSPSKNVDPGSRGCQRSTQVTDARLRRRHGSSSASTTASGGKSSTTTLEQGAAERETQVHRVCDGGRGSATPKAKSDEVGL